MKRSLDRMLLYPTMHCAVKFSPYSLYDPTSSKHLFKRFPPIPAVKEMEAACDTRLPDLQRSGGENNAEGECVLVPLGSAQRENENVLLTRLIIAGGGGGSGGRENDEAEERRGGGVASVKQFAN